jgi:hypothetical protein
MPRYRHTVSSVVLTIALSIALTLTITGCIGGEVGGGGGGGDDGEMLSEDGGVRNAASTGGATAPFRLAVTADTTPGLLNSRHHDDPWKNVAMLRRYRGDWHKLLVVGDLVHGANSRAMWKHYWVPTYGSIKGTCTVWSVPGNHDWAWQGHTPHFKNYKLFRAGWQTCPGVEPSTQWVKRRPGWLLIGLDSEHCGRAADRLAGALRFNRKHGRRSVLVAYHRPHRMPAASKAGPFNCERVRKMIRQDPLVKITLHGHSHRWDHFSPRKGLRSFIVGVGGGGTNSCVHQPLGALFLRLKPDGRYRWKYRNTRKGGAVTASGGG